MLIQRHRSVFLSVGVVPTADISVAFRDIDVCFMVGAMPRKDGMERKDLLAANVRIFKEQGLALDRVASRDVKVVVVGNPANTNAFVCSRYAPSIPKENFSCLTRLDQNRAQAQVTLALLFSCCLKPLKLYIFGFLFILLICMLSIGSIIVGVDAIGASG